MVVSPARELLMRPGYEAARRRFIQDLPRALGAVPVAGYLPHRDDRTTSVCPWSGRVWTADATMSGQLDRLGGGTARRLVAASSNYLTTPDTADLSFGNSTVDSPFSILALVNITDSAVDRVIVSKWFATANREWLFRIDAADTLDLLFRDESASANIARVSDAVIPQGSWRLFGATYSGLGGATAANGITLYQDGVVLASTATNDVNYVAMENLAGACEVGSMNAHTAAFGDGPVALIAVCAGAFTAPTMAASVGPCRRLVAVP